MALNFNTDPYYDDFDPNKNFHRILFKPGYSVQARELTQSQTILQNQISQFADAIFKQNTPVSGGQVSTNLKIGYLKLNPSYNEEDVVAGNFLNRTVQNAYGNVVARVVATAEATDADPYPTLMLNYFTGTTFANNSLVTISDVAYSYTANSISTDATGYGSIATVANGVFYIVNGYSYSDALDSNGNPLKYSVGNFVNVTPQTIILSKYNNTPNVRIGLEITETVYDYVNDTSLLDPAIGASNYQAPGADRYVVDLTLTTKPLEFGDDQNFIELVRVQDGIVVKQVTETEYSKIDDYFAKRTYETNGDYVVDNFKLTPKSALDSNNWTISIGPGVAYVHGYRVENQSTISITTTRARTLDTVNNNTVFTDYGNYFYVNSFTGANLSFIDVTQANTVDLHIVANSNVRVSNTNTYNSTVAATGYVRSIDYETATGSTANTNVYRLHMFDIQNKVLSGNISSATATTITINDPTFCQFSTVANAYTGVTVTIDSGTGINQSSIVTSYTGAPKVLTVSPPFTIPPDSTSKFSLKFDVKDVESIVAASNTGSSYTVYGYANISNLGKSNGYTTGDTILYNPSVQELLFTIGSPYVANTSGTAPTYTTEISFRNRSFGTDGTGGSKNEINLTTLSLNSAFNFLRSGATETTNAIKQNFLILVTNKGTSTSVNTGDLLDFTTGTRSIVINSAKTLATITAPDLSPGFTAVVIAKLTVIDASSNLVRKTKTLVSANTTANGAPASATVVGNTKIDLIKGQVYIGSGDIKSSDKNQLLYVSDVKNIVKILDTKGVSPNTSMFSSASYDVTSNYLFNNGQTDNYYGHSYIKLKPGAPKPTALWVFFNFYSHSGGDGYFSVDSYTNENYASIGTYISSSGRIYNLTDSLDFRPSVKNAQSNFVFRYNNEASNENGLLLPIDSSVFIHKYYYYLGRKDILTVNKDKTFSLKTGTPSLNPNFPPVSKDELLLARITLDPYTAYIQSEISGRSAILSGPYSKSNLSVEPVKHKTYKMQDITGIEERINNLEYYASLNLIEQGATSLQITDANGLNRFKNGILVDDFSTFNVCDSYNSDFSAGIDTTRGVLSSAIVVKNFPLRNLLLALTSNSPSSSLVNELPYKMHNFGNSNLYSLPYTETQLISQVIASRPLNVNSTTINYSEGSVEIYPTMDNWIDSSAEPAFMFIDPTLTQYKAVDTVNTLAGDPTLSVANWQQIPGTQRDVVSAGALNSSYNPGVTSTSAYSTTDFFGGRWDSFITTTTGAGTLYTQDINTKTYVDKQNIYTQGKWAKSYDTNLNYISNISILPYIRAQFIEFKATDLLINTKLNAFFDGQRVTRQIRKPNILELTGVSGTFKRGQSIGYLSGGSYKYTGFITDVYVYPTNTTNVRLYVSGDNQTTTYGSTVVSLTQAYEVAGTLSNSGASGTLSSSTHYSGLVSSSATGTTVTLASTASSVNNYYVGQALHIVGINASSVTSVPIGRTLVITAYNGTTKVATVEYDGGGTPSVTTVAGEDVYSIGDLTTNESGSITGIFYVPGNYFQTGPREFVLDNRIVDRSGSIYLYYKGTETTFAKTTFFAQGLSTKTQGVNFSASIQNPQTVTRTDTAASQLISDTTRQWSTFVESYTPGSSYSVYTAPPPPPPPPVVPIDNSWNTSVGEGGGQGGGGGGCCVVSTAFADQGIWKEDRKNELVEWCEKYLHNNMFGECFRKGYQVLGSKLIVPSMRSENKYLKYWKKYCVWAFGNGTNMVKGQKFNPISIPNSLVWIVGFMVTGMVVSKKYANDSWKKLYN
jgi:hypothetical protein